MSHYKPILYLFVLALFLGASCTNIATNTNEVSNTNDNALPAQTGNIEVVTNTNATSDGGGVDTSDWLTYTNEDYGFSFKYPSEWSIVSPGSGKANNSIYLYSNFPNSDGNEKLTNDEIKIDVQFIAAQDQFLDEDSLCHRKYTTLESTDYKISCNKKQAHGFDFLQIETEIFPNDELPGDNLSMLYTNLNEIPFQVSMDAYFGSSNGLDSSDRMIVEQIFSSMQTE